MMMYLILALVLSFLSSVSSEVLGDPANQYHSKCNTSLIREDYMYPIWPVREIMRAGSGNYTLYLSHIKHLLPFWCVAAAKPDFLLLFNFKTTMFITGFSSEGEPGRYFSSLQMSYSADHVLSTYSKMSWDQYIEDRSSAEAKIFNVGSEKQTHQLLFPFAAISVEFKIIQAMDSACIRVEILGCFASKLYCADDSPTFGGHCYSGNSSPNFTQSEAEDKCSEGGSELLVVDSHAEAEFLKSLIPYGYWLGLRRQKNLEFFYESGYGTAYYFDWAWGDPTVTRATDYYKYVTYMKSDSSTWWETLTSDVLWSYGFFCIGQPTEDGECPHQKSTLFDGYCYHYFNSSFVSHSSAYYQCWTKDMWIGIIHSSKVKNFIKEFLPTTPWTGLRKNVNGTFMYANDTFPLADKSWQFWMTDDETGEAQPGIHEYQIDCVIIDGSYGKGNNWKDRKCSSYYSFICQQEKINGSCADSWTDLLHDGFCYINIPDKIEQSYAKDVCQQLEGELLRYHSNDTHHNISEIISNWYRTWIGDTGAIIQPLPLLAWSVVSALKAEGGYSNWSPEQSSEDLLAVSCVVSAGSQGHWEIVDCQETLLYLCEKDPGQPETAPISQIYDLSANVISTSTDTLAKIESISNGLDNTVLGLPVEPSDYVSYPETYCLGNDISHLTNVSPEECGHQCSTITNCIAFVYSYTLCYFKHICERIYTTFPATTYMEITSRVKKTLAPVYGLWPLDSTFHGLELTEQCEHADLVGVTIQNDTDPFLPLSGLNRERIEVAIPEFLTEPAANQFSLVVSILWRTASSFPGTLFGFGTVTSDLQQLFSVYSLKVSLTETQEFLESSNTNSTVHRLQVFTTDLLLASEEVHVDTDTWYTIGLTLEAGVLTLYFDGQHVLAEAVGNEDFISASLLTSKSRILIGGGDVSIDVQCLQIYEVVLEPAEVLIASHRCTSGVSAKKIKTTTICDGHIGVMSCPTQSSINIIHAKYGRNQPYSSGGVCTERTSTGLYISHCTVDVTARLQWDCQGQSRCLFVSGMSNVGLVEEGFPCDTKIVGDRYLQIHWNCQPTVPCDDDWWFRADKCYTWSNVPRTRADAAVDCEERNARLPVINSTDTQTAVKDLFVYRKWLSLEDAEEEGVFVWPDGQEPNETHWVEGYPEQQYLIENCTQLMYEADQLTHNDIFCHYKKSYMCKRRYEAAICDTYILRLGDSIQRGQRLCSEDGRFSVVLQSDGNLVVKDEHTVTFATGTTSADFLIMSLEGVLQLKMQDNTMMTLCDEPGGKYAKISARGYLSVYSAFQNMLWTANNKDCYRTWYGYDYTGVHDVSSFGTPCKQWSNDTGLEVSRVEDNLPDGRVEDAGSFCRNPSKQKTPGCYPSYVSEAVKTDWEACDIPSCGEGHDGFLEQEDNCHSIFDTVDASAAILYEPGYEYYNVYPNLSANALVDTRTFTDQQLGGVCLHDTEDSPYPGWLKVVFNKTQRISGLIVQTSNRPSWKEDLISGVDVYYSSDGMNWTEFVDVDFSTSVGPYEPGRHIFSQPFNTKYLKLAPHYREEVQCFRMDLLTCNANVVYKELAVNYRRGVAFPKHETLNETIILAKFDDQFYLSPYYTEDPFLYVILSSEQYILAVNVTYPGADQADIVGSTYGIFLPKDRPNQNTLASDEDLCTEVQVIAVPGEGFYRCKTFKSTRYVMFQTSGYSRLAFDEILIHIPTDPVGLEMRFNDIFNSSSSTSGENGFNDTATSSERMSAEDQALHVQFMAHIQYEDEMVVSSYDTAFGKYWTTGSYKMNLESGLLNDGLLFNGHCLHLEYQHLPTIYIILKQRMYVAEVRITTPKDAPFDSLYNLSIALEYDNSPSPKLTSSYVNPNSLVTYERDKCLMNQYPVLASDTQSYICPESVLTGTLLIYKNSLDILRVCEVEVYRDSDKTDIPLPTWESDWQELEYLSANENKAYNHHLGVTPVYGRILLKSKSGVSEDVYILDSALSERSAEQLGLKGVIYLSYNKDQYVLSASAGWTSMHVMCSNESWTVADCYIEGGVLFKVQLWTLCGFPLPSFMSPWETNNTDDMVLMLHHLGESPTFGYMQVEYSINSLFQTFIRQISGFPANKSSIQNKHLGMVFDQNSIMLGINSNVLRYRALLWYKLGKSPPVYQQTFPIEDFVGPQKLKLPPYSPDRSIITVVVTVKTENSTFQTLAPYVGDGGVLFAFNSQYLKLRWLHNLQLDDMQEVSLIDVTVTIYRIGSEVLDNTFCEPYTDVHTNLFLECGRWMAAAVCDQTESEEGTSSTYTVTCNTDNRTWTEAQCDQQSADGEVISLKTLSGYSDGYQYMVHTKQLPFNEGRSLCVDQESKILALPTKQLLEGIMTELINSGVASGEVYLDAVEMLPFVDVFDIEEVVNNVTQHNSTTYQTIQYSFDNSSDVDYYYKPTENTTVIESRRCLVLKYEVSVFSFEASNCSVPRTVICRKPVCHDRNKFRFVPYMYRRIESSSSPYEVAVLPDSCLSYCFDRYHCKSVEYNSLTRMCSLYDHQVSINKDPNITALYGESTVYRKDCKTAYDPAWEVFFAINLTSLQNSTMGIFYHLFELGHTEDEDIYPYSLYDRVYMSTKRDYMAYMYQIKVSMMTAGEEVAYISLPTFGRGLSLNTLPYDTFVVSSTNLNLSSTDLYPVFLFSLCKPDDAYLSTRNVIIFETEHCSENGTILPGYPLSPQVLYRDPKTDTLIPSEVLVLSTNSFCWRYLNIDDLSQKLSQEYNIRIANTNFFQFSFVNDCDNAMITLYDNTKPWNYDAYVITFYSEHTYKIRVYEKGITKVQNFQNKTVQCQEQRYWIRWIAGSIEIGIGLSDDPGNIVVKYETGVFIEPNDIAVANADIKVPEETSCPPLVLANTTHKVIRPSEGSCRRYIECLPGYEIGAGLEGYHTECVSQGYWTVLMDCQKKQCNETTIPNSDLVNVTAYFQDNLTVVCDEDHFAFGNENISKYFTVCNASSQFQPVEPCMRLPCEELTVEYSNVSGYVAEYQDQVLVECEAGFEIETGEGYNYTAHCQSNRTWAPRYTCQRMRCPLLSLNNTNITGAAGVHEDVLKAYCSLGHAVNKSCHVGSMYGDTTVSCDYEFTVVCEAGIWNVTSACERKPCVTLNVPYSDHEYKSEIVPVYSPNLYEDPQYVYEDIVNVTCDPGAVVSSSLLDNHFTTVCLSNGTWGNLMYCERKPCTNHSVTHAEPPMLRGYYGNTVTVSCDDGYFFPNQTNMTEGYYLSVENLVPKYLNDPVFFIPDFIKDQNVTCLANFKWNITVSECVRVPCANLTLLHSNVSDHVGLYGDVVEVLCDYGHASPVSDWEETSFTTTCTNYSVWDINMDLIKALYQGNEYIINQVLLTMQYCDPVPCLPVFFENSNYSASLTSVTGTFSDIITVQCDVGYEVTGTDQTTFSIECHANRSWSPQLTCSKVVCEGLHANNVLFTNATAGLYDDEVTGYCHEDYVVDGTCEVTDVHVESCVYSLTAKCLYDKTWQVSGNCTEIPCIHLSIPGTNVSTITSGALGDVVEVSCLEGYWISETSPTAYRTRCEENSQWNNTDPCVLKPCFPLTVGNSSASYVLGVYKDTVTVMCYTGFESDLGTSSVTVQCMADRTWDNSSFTCSPKQCPPLIIEKSSAVGINGSFGDYFDVICDFGYEAADAASPTFRSVCEYDGQWSNLQNCTRVSCCCLPQGLSSVDLVNSSLLNGLYEEKILYQCASGYSSIEGDHGPWSVCEGNGSWTNPPFCHVDCLVRDLQVDPQASFLALPVTLRTLYGEDIQVTCPVGFKPLHQTLSCGEGGQWNISDASCVALDCGNPLSPVGTEVIWSSSSYKSEAVYSCQEGFSQMEGTSISTCGLDEQWTQAPTCYHDCEPLPVQDNGLYSTNDTHYTTVVTVTCLNKTFYLNSSINEVQCMDDGNWTNTIGHCIFVPVDGQWLTWTQWSDCTASCGVQQSSRSRDCLPPSHEGLPCTGSANESKACEISPCDADGHWITWTSWTECSVSCSGGSQTRKRECIGPYGTGQPCDGEGLLTRSCSNIDCPKVSCTPPPQVEHTVQLGNSQFVGSVVVYLCQQQDMEFADGTQETFIRCTHFGTWFPSTVPACESVKCPEQILPSGTLRSTALRFINTTVAYSCWTGYHFKDSTDRSSSFCNQNRVWSHDPPKCVAKQCDSSLTGAISTEAPEKVNYGDHVMVSCHQGTRLKDGRDEQIEECGARRRISDICSDTHCPPIPLVSNASVIYFNQSMVMFKCYRGHRFPNGYQLQSIVCSDKTQWEPEYIKGCLIITCPPVPDVANASPNDTNAIYGTHIRIQCLPGYQFEVNLTSVVIECTDTGQWDKEPTNCFEVVCGIPPLVGNASRSYTNVSLDDQAQYSCLEYHRFSNGYNQLTISCTTSSTWEPIDKACSIERCEPVPVPANAHSNTDSAVIDTMATISCDLGYTLPEEGIDPQLTLCKRDTKLWSIAPQDCIPIECPVLTPGDHVLLSTSDHHYDTKVNISCEPRYWFDPATAVNDSNELVPVTLTCLYNESWTDSNMNLSCHRLQCPDLFQVAHAQVDSSSRYAGDEVTYTCAHGFHFPDTEEDDRVLRCMDNGVWSEQLDINCEIKSCPPFTSWNNVVVDTNETVYSTVVKVSCSEGYSFTGAPSNSSVVAECGADKLWYPEIPVCEVTENTTVAVPVEAEKSSVIGGVIIFTLAGLFSVIVITDLVTYYPLALQLLKTNVYPHLLWLKKHLTKKVSPGSVSENQGSEFAEIDKEDTQSAGSMSDLSRPMSGVSKDSVLSQRSDTPLSARGIHIHGLTTASLHCIEECVTPEVGIGQSGQASVDIENTVLINSNELTGNDVPFDDEALSMPDVQSPELDIPPCVQFDELFNMTEFHQQDEPFSVDTDPSNIEQGESPEPPPSSVEDQEWENQQQHESEDTQLDSAFDLQDMEGPSSVSELAGSCPTVSSAAQNVAVIPSSSHGPDQDVSSHQVDDEEDTVDHDSDELEGILDPESVDGVDGPPTAQEYSLQNERSHLSADRLLENLNLEVPNGPDIADTGGYAGFHDPPHVTTTDSVSSPPTPAGVGEQGNEGGESLSRASSGYNSAHGSFMAEQDLG